MCIFPVENCFCCIGLPIATKLIGFSYAMLSVGLSVLYGVPLVLAWGVIPLSRSYFYSGIVMSAIIQFITSCLLIYGTFRKKPRLLWPWVVSAVSSGLSLALVSVAGMVTLPLRFLNKDTAAAESGIISFYFTYALLLLYFSSVVNSYRQQLVDLQQSEATKRLMFPVMYQPKGV